MWNMHIGKKNLKTNNKKNQINKTIYFFLNDFSIFDSYDEAKNSKN